MALVLAAGFVAACGAYAHENPFDPKTDTRIVIHGPDSITSLNSYVQFTAEVTPDWAGVVPHWTSNNGDVLMPSASRPGAFVAYTNGSVLVFADVGGHSVSHPVIVWQRPWQPRFDCYNVPCATMTRIGEVDTLRVSQLDSAGSRVTGGTPWMPLEYEIGDTTVARIAQTATWFVRVRAVANGTTYVVVRLAGRADTTDVVVSAP